MNVVTVLVMIIVTVEIFWNRTLSFFLQCEFLTYPCSALKHFRSLFSP